MQLFFFYSVYYKKYPYYSNIDIILKQKRVTKRFENFYAYLFPHCPTVEKQWFKLSLIHCPNKRPFKNFKPAVYLCREGGNFGGSEPEIPFIFVLPLLYPVNESKALKREVAVHLKYTIPIYIFWKSFKVAMRNTKLYILGGSSGGIIS